MPTRRKAKTKKPRTSAKAATRRGGKSSPAKWPGDLVPGEQQIRAILTQCEQEAKLPSARRNKEINAKYHELREKETENRAERKSSQLIREAEEAVTPAVENACLYADDVLELVEGIRALCEARDFHAALPLAYRLGEARARMEFGLHFYGFVHAKYKANADIWNAARKSKENRADDAPLADARTRKQLIDQYNEIRKAHDGHSRHRIAELIHERGKFR